MEDRDLVSLILARLEMLGSRGHCRYPGDCWAKSCQGCSDYIIDMNEYDESMKEIYEIIGENK